MINLNKLALATSQLNQQELPFLTRFRQRMIDEKPYQGLKILHNTPIALITVFKIETLVLGGADVTVMNTAGHPPNQECLHILSEANINFAVEYPVNEQYDIFLDCCAQLIDETAPKYGAVELTQSGSIKYQTTALEYPVISVDDTKIKYIENYYGTGDGFIRGFCGLTNKEINDKKFIVFGYGKVGKGILHALGNHTDKLVVVDKNPLALADATKKGITAVSMDDKKEIKYHLKDAFCAVTATGVKDVISNHFDKEDFAGIYLAHMGVIDEFGYKFSSNEILFNKQLINFSLSEPTRIRYLDPVFYAHNIVVDQLLTKSLGAGFYPFSPELDWEILKQWAEFHGEDLASVHAVVGA